jgi:hypothetical protein
LIHLLFLYQKQLFVSFIEETPPTSIYAPTQRYPVVLYAEEVDNCTASWLDPLKETPLNITITCLAVEGIPVNSAVVPLVVVTGVPRVKPEDTVAQVGAEAPAEVNTCPEEPAAVNAGALEPAEYRTPPAEPAAVVAYSVPLPYVMPPAVGVLLPLMITVMVYSNA